MVTTRLQGLGVEALTPATITPANMQTERSCCNTDYVPDFYTQMRTYAIPVVPQKRSITNLCLGVMAGLLDKVASTHVFGNYGSRDRRKGLITLGTIQDTEKHQELSSSSEHRWHQFLEVWHTAGWGRFDVIVMVDELRPLLWRHPQQPEHIASIDAQQMAVYCAKYSRCQGHRHSELQTSLLSFLDAVQNQFSSPNAVLLPAEDVYDRLSTVKLSHYEAQSPP